VPLIVNPYGGPGPADGGQPLERRAALRRVAGQHGFAVLHADNRGMGMRGRAFAQAAYHNFGPVQLEDQLTVVDAALAQYPQLDPQAPGLVGLELGRHVSRSTR
jgi:dipeptidyl-peptidase 4